jgi:hypothetical protein
MGGFGKIYSIILKKNPDVDAIFQKPVLNPIAQIY